MVHFPSENTHREAEKPVVGDYPAWLDGTPEVPVGTPGWCTLATDKIEGLTADLRLAVQVAWRRGAKDWARLNYPQWVPWLEACDVQAATQQWAAIVLSEATPTPSQAQDGYGAEGGMKPNV